MRTWDEIAFRAGHEMNDQTDDPGRGNPAEDRDQLRVLRITRLRVFHDPDGGEDPGADGYGNAKEISDAAGNAQARYAGRSGSRGGSIFGTRRIARAGRSTLGKQICGQEQKGQGSDRSLHGPNA